MPMTTHHHRDRPNARRGAVQRLAAALIAVVMTAGGAGAQDVTRDPARDSARDYPVRPVRWVIGFSAGGSTDIVARILGAWLQERLGQPFLIENRPGAGSNLAAETVVNAPPDGYTLLAITSANAINATVNKKSLSFDLTTQIAPVAGTARGPNVLVVHPAVPVATVADFIAYAKARPGRLNMGTPGIGTTGHLAGALFKTMAGLDLLDVPYRGSAPAVSDLIAGQVQMMVDAMVTTLPHIQSGKLRALAVTTATRSPALPDLPTIAETVPGYEAFIWFGVGAPRGTSPDIVAKLNREINAGLATAKIAAQFADLGATPIIASPGEFGAFVRAETAKWERVIATAGVKVD